MQMKIKYFKIRKAVAIIFAIAIAVCCAHHSSFQSVAATAMKNTAVQNTVQMPQVYPCGFPVGIYMETEGVMVVTTAQIPTNMETLSSPCEGSLQQGDYITSINGNPVNSKEELVSSVEACAGQPLTLHIVREQESFDISVLPIQDTSGTYRLGVWVKDDVQGIGTLTYATRQGAFGALGHGITDTDTGKLLTVSGGMLYDTSILKIVRGQRGTPGELSGMITYSDSHAEGVIRENTSRGIFGQAEGRLLRMLGTETVEVAFKQEVRTGRAVLRSSVSGELKDYEIQIQELRMNESDVNKGMIFYVTDPDLLALTGGVIQGMSGSPILQNGRLIGAVTHVFVNDPTKGYGIFIENMME